MITLDQLKTEKENKAKAKELLINLVEEYNDENCFYEQLIAFLEEQVVLNEKMKAMFENNPLMGTLFIKVLNNECTFRAGLIKYLGTDFFNIDEESEEYAQLVNADNEYIESVKREKENEENRTENLTKNIIKIKEFCEDFAIDYASFLDEIIEYIYNPIMGESAIETKNLFAWKIAIENSKYITENVIEEAEKLQQNNKKIEDEQKTRKEAEEILQYIARVGAKRWERKEPDYSYIKNEKLAGLLKKKLHIRAIQILKK